MDSFGLWGIVPPLLTILLAFITKDVIVSLFIGTLSAALIVGHGNPVAAFITLTDLISDNLADGWNIRIFLFCALLGGLVGLLTKTGAAGSFGRWASARLKNGRGSQLLAFFFGILIFIDDYFNSLTVGTIMRPVSDKTKVPRAKLAYILDSTAAPVCILAPISSWVVTVMSIVRDASGFRDEAGNYLLGMNEFQFFIKSIPYNLYALTTLAMVLAIILTGRDFGPMRESIRYANETGKMYNEKKYGPASGNLDGDTVSRAKPFDMLFPIIVLIVTAIVFFPLTTWLSAIDGETIKTFGAAVASMSLGDAFNNTDSSKALMYAIVITVTITYIYYLARRLLTLSESSEALRNGVKSMVPALIILAMAWAIGSIIKTPKSEGGLGLGYYLSSLVSGGSFPVGILPAIMFLFSAVIAFSTGTSWGTFSIMIPIAMPIVTALAQSHGYDLETQNNDVLITIAAVVGGAVFGDHASPISDTTILSSTGAGMPHLEHVATQMPYAIFVACCSFLGFIVGGLSMNIIICWAVTLAALAAGLIFLPNLLEKKSGKA